MPNEIATHGGPPHRASDRSASARRGGSSGRGTRGMPWTWAWPKQEAWPCEYHCDARGRPGPGACIAMCGRHSCVRIVFQCILRMSSRCTITAYCESFLLQLL